MLFLPSLWLFAFYVSPEWAGVIGAVWLVGRVLYARGYYVATAKRVPGFIIGIASSSVLLLGAIVAIMSRLISQLTDKIARTLTLP